MKKNLISIICFISGFVYSQQSGSLGISKNLSFTPNAKAILDVESNDAGVLFPRLTTAQRDAIAVSPQEDGLLIYNTDVKCFEYYHGQSFSWKQMCAGAPAIPAPLIKLVHQKKNIKTTL